MCKALLPRFNNRGHLFIRFRVYREYFTLEIPKFNFNMINIKTYNINNSTLSPATLQVLVARFWSEVYTSLDHTNSYLSLMVKVRFEDSSMGYRSLAKLRNVSYADKDLFTDYICDNLALLSDTYVSNVALNVDFTYMEHEGDVTEQDRNLLSLRQREDQNTKTHTIKSNSLPVSMNPSDFGNVIRKVVSVDGNTYYTIKGPRKEIFEIEVLSGGIVNKGQIIGGVGGSAQFVWEDTKQANGFVRTDGGKQSWHFYDNGVVSYKVVPANPFKVFSKDSKLDTNVIC